MDRIRKARLFGVASTLVVDGHPSPAMRARRSRGALGRRVLHVVVVLALAAGVFYSGSVPAQAFPPHTERPVLFVHGYRFNNSYDCNSWNGLENQLSTEGGFPIAFMRTVGFYSNDSNCDVDLREYYGYDEGGSWIEKAKAFSWYVYYNYTIYDRAVDAVGHSMGGLIIRGAIQGAQAGEEGFSPPINVKGVVTLGTPHNGAAWFTNFCFTGECSHLRPNSAAIDWLDDTPWPQGVQGTMWSAIGSTNDSVVPLASALDIVTYIDRRTTFERLGHGDYVGNWAVGNITQNYLTDEHKHMYAQGSGPAWKCIDAKLSGTAPGTPVQLYDCNNSYAQLQTFTTPVAHPGSPTTIQILGRCLDVPGSRFEPGVLIQLWPCNGTSAQTWNFDASTWEIRIQGLCLDVPNWNFSNWVQLQLWYCNGTTAQDWWYY